MNFLVALIANIYSRILKLYPRKFKDEFALEMNDVFRNSVVDAAEEGVFHVVVVCGRELWGLPFNILREFWHEVGKKKENIHKSEKPFSEARNGKVGNPGEALIGTLPFMLFGLVSTLTKIGLPIHDAYLYLPLYFFVLVGLYLGLIKGVPRWTYVFLGWSLILARWSWWWTSWSLWWTAVSTQELKILGIELNYLGWQTWIPLLATLAGVLILRGSFSPFLQLVKGIWRDWTLLSVAMYTFIGFMMLLYDENHSQYLILFMIASTLAVSASVWVFMRSAKSLGRFLALLSGFIASIIINWTSESTWNIAAYYGLPSGPPVAWYDSILGLMALSGFWGGILLLPALVSFVQRAIKTE